MATKKRAAKDGDRQLMDASGGTAAKGKDFLQQKKAEDKMDAKAKKLNKGLRNAKESNKVLVTALAHGMATESDEAKKACLEEVATLAESIRDGSRTALREAAAETRNLQPAAKVY